MTQSVRVRPVSADDFAVEWEGGPARVIGLVPGQIVTESLVEELSDGTADPERDLAKIAVIERHLGTGRIGLGFVRGFGLTRGAFASTFSHDAHNVVVVGMSDAEMALAVERLVELGGGLVVVDGATVTAELPLPVAGLLSDRRAGGCDRGQRGDGRGRARARLARSRRRSSRSRFSPFR